LLLFYLATSTYVLGKSACWTDLSHDTQFYITAEVYKTFKSIICNQTPCNIISPAGDSPSSTGPQPVLPAKPRKTFNENLP
jgi:hypothetical protein